MKKCKYIYVFLIILFSLGTVNAQYFGKNKVQYKNFNWRYIQSEHFDIYFYEGGYDIARFTAEAAESAYVEVKSDFEYEISERIAIVVYKSHNDFQQTNVVYSYLQEGIGGVTELFKNRVVLPYEGSYSQFRHVIHHELVHAVMNDMLYGGSVQSLVSGQITQVPTWFAEGIAEYGSLRWDTRLDMVVRDATISGYLPPIEFLNYFPYQGGASVFRYIAQKYGKEKIGEIINKIKGSFRFETAFRSALGIDFKDLTEEWQRQMKREYWPDIADRKEPGEFAKTLTKHTEEKNYLNVSPAISPQGDKMIFLSDMDGKQSIYLMDVLEGKIIKKLIKGQTSVDFEELHFLEPGFGWSPDSKQITLAAKAGDEDALYIYNIETEDIEQYKFGLDGIFSTSWSPRGNEIAFSGNKDGARDIYIFSLETKDIINITKDVFTDNNPSWSPDGERIIFTSDRGDYPIKKYSPSEFDMHLHDYENEDIYIVNRDGSELIRVTDYPTIEDNAIFAPDGETVAYVSEYNGIPNIYIQDLNTGENYPITNLITGAFQLSWDKQAKKLAFTSFYKGGWDIFLLKNPLEMPKLELTKTEYFQKLAAGDDLFTKKATVEENTQEKIEQKSDEAPLVTDYSKYVFADMDNRTPEKKEKITLPESDYKSDDGDYKIRNYKIKFSPDIINGAAGYDTFFGLQGFTQIALSDMLGNHKIYIGTNLVFDLRNSNISTQYWYLPNRIDYGFGAFHISNFFRTSTGGLLRFRNFGFNAIASRPFNKFTRLDLSLTWFNVNLEYLDFDIPTEKIGTILPGLSLVNDEIDWGMTGPQSGRRASITTLISPKYGDNSLDFKTLKVDYRKYFKLADNYSLAFRLHAGGSIGENPQKFFLGGVNNWFNRSFKGGRRIDKIEDVFFSEFITPLRGARYYEQIGKNFGLFNFEFRFPLIPYMQLGLPPIQLGNIQGAFFTDIGSAWDNTNTWKGVHIGEDGKKRTKDLLAGYGFGARIFIFGLLMRIDMAWKYDIATTSTPTWYWSLGADF